MLQRIKNLWALSKYAPENAKSGTELKTVLKDTRKPKKRLATVVQDDPIDLFPNEETDDSAN
jgi:hypothetical protein